MPQEQKELIRLEPVPGFVFINDQVYFCTEGTERVIFVHGVVFAHYDVTDRAAEAYAIEGGIESETGSCDIDPLNRCMDRLLAAMGLIEDATPQFAKACSVPRTGVLLAIPALVASGLLSVARRIYGSIGPAFYGLRTNLVAYVLLSLLRIPPLRRSR